MDGYKIEKVWDPVTYGTTQEVFLISRNGVPQVWCTSRPKAKAKAWCAYRERLDRATAA